MSADSSSGGSGISRPSGCGRVRVGVQRQGRADWSAHPGRDAHPGRHAPRGPACPPRRVRPCRRRVRPCRRGPTVPRPGRLVDGSGLADREPGRHVGGVDQLHGADGVDGGGGERRTVLDGGGERLELVVVGGPAGELLPPRARRVLNAHPVPVLRGKGVEHRERPLAADDLGVQPEDGLGEHGAAHPGRAALGQREARVHGPVDAGGGKLGRGAGDPGAGGQQAQQRNRVAPHVHHRPAGQVEPVADVARLGQGAAKAMSICLMMPSSPDCTISTSRRVIGWYCSGRPP